MNPETDKKRLESPAAGAKAPAGPHIPEPHPDQREHQGATEDQVVETIAPSGSEYEDEPKQG